MSLNFHSVWHWTVEEYRIKNSINFHFLIFVLSFKLSQSITYKCTGLLHTSWAKISRIQLRFFFLAIQRRKGYEKPKKFFTTPTLHFTDPVLLIWRTLGAASFLTLSGWMVFVKKIRQPIIKCITAIFSLPFCFIFLFVAAIKICLVFFFLF